MAVVRGLIQGAITGYVVRVLQIVVSLLVVPFLIQESVLGLDGYGQIFTLIAFVSILSLIMDGIKLSQARFIAQTIHEKPRLIEMVGSSVRLVFILAVIIIAFVAVFEEGLLPFFGLGQSPGVEVSMYILLLIFLVETTFYFYEPLLHAAERSYFVNIISGIEVIGRNIAMVLYFIWSEPGIVAYFFIQLVFTLFRLAVFHLWSRDICPSILSGVASSSFRDAMPMIKYSLPMSGRGMSTLLVYRGAVLVSSKFLGAEAAGIVSLVIGTIRNYLVQTLHSVFRPMMVPMLSRFNIAVLSPEKISLMTASISLYTTVVFLIGGVLIGIMTELIELWLGATFSHLVMPIQAVIFAATLELTGSIKAALLVSQGEAKAMAVLELPISVLALAVMVFLMGKYLSWEIIIATTVVYGAVSGGLLVEWVFGKCIGRFMADKTGVVFNRLVSSLLICGVAAWISGLELEGMGMMGAIAIKSVLAACAGFVAVHIFIIDMRDIIPRMRSIFRAARS